MFMRCLYTVLGLCFSQREYTYIPVNENEACSGSVNLVIRKLPKDFQRTKKAERKLTFCSSAVLSLFHSLIFPST